MQSSTKSGLPESISSSEDESYNNTFASTWHSGKIDRKCFLRHKALGVPTSSLVATACRFNDETDTFTINNFENKSYQANISRIILKYLWFRANIQLILLQV